MEYSKNHLMMLMQKRRSVRDYTGAAIADEKLEEILQAGLLAPSAMNRRPCRFTLVRDKKTLAELALSREVGAAMMNEADACIVVWGDEDVSPLYTEDSCIAAAFMLLMAERLGVGACWVQGRGRTASDGRSTEEFIMDLLHAPASYRLECMIALGTPKDHPEGHELPDTQCEMVAREHY